MSKMEKEEVKEEKHESKELDNIKKQLEEQKDKYLRLLAEFDNFRKKTQKDIAMERKYANEMLILELIDVLESLERGLENSKKSENKDKLIEGIQLAYKQFKNVLEKHGLKAIKAVGERFDPYKHEVVMLTENDEHEEGIIMEEFAKGYMLNDKVIRCSKVRVSKKKEAKE